MAARVLPSQQIHWSHGTKYKLQQSIATASLAVLWLNSTPTIHCLHTNRFIPLISMKTLIWLMISETYTAPESYYKSNSLRYLRKVLNWLYSFMASGVLEELLNITTNTHLNNIEWLVRSRLKKKNLFLSKPRLLFFMETTEWTTRIELKQTTSENMYCT